MKKYTGWFAVMGFCAFIALMCSGFYWIISLIPGISAPILLWVKRIADLILTLLAVFSGWLWIRSAKMNRTAKVIFEVLFVVFAVLAVLGICGISF